MGIELESVPFLYGLRFKIEHGFKQAKGVIGTYGYHLWMQDMQPLHPRQGNQHLHKKPKVYRDNVHRKIKTYHVQVQDGFVAQGLMQYLSITEEQRVWLSFGSWLCTIRAQVAPSERVVGMSLRNALPQFLPGSGEKHALATFITDRQDTDLMPKCRLGA